jgi:hypothetical protein
VTGRQIAGAGTELAMLLAAKRIQRGVTVRFLCWDGRYREMSLGEAAWSHVPKDLSQAYTFWRRVRDLHGCPVVSALTVQSVLGRERLDLPVDNNHHSVADIER